MRQPAGAGRSRSGNPRSRVLEAWEPNATQRATIAEGPQVNRRGMRVKTLRGSDAKGWRSPRRSPARSASVIGYREDLTIEGLDALPRFVREDVVGNALTGTEGGGSRYTVERIRDGGRELTGRYVRDDRQKGTFRMWRTPPVRGLPDKDEGGEPGGRGAPPSPATGPDPVQP